MVADTGSFTSWFDDIEGGNPLGFPGYEEKLHAVQEKTGLKEGVVIGKAQIYGEDTVLVLVHNPVWVVAFVPRVETVAKHTITCAIFIQIACQSVVGVQ